MKATLKFWTALLCAGLVLGGCDDPIAPEIPDNEDENPPVEQPGDTDEEKPDDENPDDSEKPLTDGSLFTIQINDDIMATVGSVSWSSIVSGSGKFVATGGNEIAYTTEISGDWTVKDMEERCYGLVYGNGVFILIRNDGTGSYNEASLWYSSNVENWNICSSNTHGRSWSKVVFGDGVFVAIDTEGVTAYSNDGINWVIKAITDADRVDGICFGNGKFVILDTTSASDSRIFYSEDGVDWELKDLDGYYTNITFDGGRFMVYSTTDFAYSDNGVDWIENKYDFGCVHGHATYANGTFVVIGDYTLDPPETSTGGLLVSSAGKIGYSKNGVDWNTVEAKENITSFNGICYSEGSFMAYGEYDEFYDFDTNDHTSRGVIMVSPNGIDWTVKNYPTIQSITFIYPEY